MKLHGLHWALAALVIHRRSGSLPQSAGPKQDEGLYLVTPAFVMLTGDATAPGPAQTQHARCQRPQAVSLTFGVGIRELA